MVSETFSLSVALRDVFIREWCMDLNEKNADLFRCIHGVCEGVQFWRNMLIEMCLFWFGLGWLPFSLKWQKHSQTQQCNIMSDVFPAFYWVMLSQCVVLCKQSALWLNDLMTHQLGICLKHFKLMDLISGDFWRSLVAQTHHICTWIASVSKCSHRLTVSWQHQ